MLEGVRAGDQPEGSAPLRQMRAGPPGRLRLRCVAIAPSVYAVGSEGYLSRMGPWPGTHAHAAAGRLS